jgi:hypothetical protein
LRDSAGIKPDFARHNATYVFSFLISKWWKINSK